MDHEITVPATSRNARAAPATSRKARGRWTDFRADGVLTTFLAWAPLWQPCGGPLVGSVPPPRWHSPRHQEGPEPARTLPRPGRDRGSRCHWEAVWVRSTCTPPGSLQGHPGCSGVGLPCPGRGGRLLTTGLVIQGALPQCPPGERAVSCRAGAWSAGAKDSGCRWHLPGLHPPGRKGLLSISQCAHPNWGAGRSPRSPPSCRAQVGDCGRGHLPGVAAAPRAAAQDTPGRWPSVRASQPAGERLHVCCPRRGWHPDALPSARSEQGSPVRA